MMISKIVIQTYMKYHSKNRKDMISRSYRFMMRMVVLSVTLLLASNVMAQKLRPFVYIGIGGAEYDSNGTAEGSFHWVGSRIRGCSLRSYPRLLRVDAFSVLPSS